MNGATLRLAYDNGKKLDNISAFIKEAHQISDEAKFQKERKNRTREQVMDNWGEHTESRGLAKAKGRKPIDYLSEEKIQEAMLKEGYTISDEQRTKSKQALRTNTYRLLRKAEANIKAVENGMFGVGHLINIEVKPLY